MKHSVYAIIPVRYGSTRFVGQPLHIINGKMLMQHVYDKSVRAKGLDGVIIATDDMRIAEAAFDFGADVALTSAEHTTGTDRIAEVTRHLKNATHILNIQGDEPLVDPRLITRLANKLVAEPELQMITAASPLVGTNALKDLANPNVVKVVTDSAGNALYFSRAAIPFQREGGTKPAPLRHHGIYGYSRKLLLQFVRWKPTLLENAEKLEQLRALEHGVRIRVLTTAHESVGVDTREDAARVERFLRSRGE